MPFNTATEEAEDEFCSKAEIITFDPELAN